MTQSYRLPRWLPAVALLSLVLIAYWPVIRTGGFVWDDPQHVTENPTLRDLGGLADIWVHPQSIPQYYPLTHTTFWIEYHLWKLGPRGYHIDNILLHGLSAILLWRLLVRLNFPTAWLAAAIFALHPVQVESVAWITERKNVLSGVFYFASLHAYLEYAGNDWQKAPRALGKYWLAIAFFVAALLSKSVTASLPAAVLLLAFWKRGRISWADVRPTLPMFALGLMMSALTAWLERSHVGAFGSAWDFSWADRCLIAGRAVWFYIAKLFWPWHLSFVYPRWVNMHFLGRPWLSAFPLAVLGLILALWMLRKSLGRGPLVAILFFVGTLFPALGFVNVFPMRYTFVADHYQYLACIGVIVIAAALLHRWLRWASILVLIPLIILSRMQGAIYEDPLKLWLDTREKDPTSWMVWGNLGDEYAARGDRYDARICYRKLRQLAPDESIAHWKWGIVLEYDDDWDGAVEEFSQSIELDRSAADAQASMGLALVHLHRPSEALGYFQKALELEPQKARTHYDYALALHDAGNRQAAREQCQIALRLDPDIKEAAQLLLALDMGN